MENQWISQPDADEIVRIVITCFPEKTLSQLAVLAMREGMPLSQAIHTVDVYADPYLPPRLRKCVKHNICRCDLGCFS